MKKRKLNIKNILILIIVVVAIISIIYILIKPVKQKDVPKKKTTVTDTTKNYYIDSYKNRYEEYQKNNPSLTKEEVVTRVNMNLDYPFYGTIVNQDKPLELDTIVNKYYKLADDFELNDLVNINDNYSGKDDPAYSYRNHQMRQVVYDDFQALKQVCRDKGFNLYVVSGYRSTKWQNEIYNHMVDTYDQATADNTCSRPGHSEHTLGLGCDIALDSYKFEEIVNHPQYSWFVGILADYGFIIRYPEGKEALTGYSYESWHIRYLGKSLAKKVTATNLTYDEYYARYIMNKDQ